MASEPDEIRAHADAYLRAAGWSPLETVCGHELAARHTNGTRTLTLRYEADRGLVRLEISFRRGEVTSPLFEGGTAHLRIFTRGIAVLGLLCWITTRPEEPSPDGLADWFDQVVALCPDTYAVISRRGEPEALVLVTRGDTPRVLH